MEEVCIENTNPSIPQPKRNKSNIWGFQQPPYQQEKKPNLKEMLSKFISMSETRFQNIETALKNQQASIQGLETQIGQLSKLISERPQGSLPSNTEPNPREHLNAISTQDKEGFIALEPELMQETLVSKSESEVSHNKMVNEEYRPRVPYPNATIKDRSEEQFGELTLRVGDETITLPACNSSITSNIAGHIHEERRLRIEELDEWRAHKLRAHDKPKLCQNKPDTSPNQLKVGDKVLLDAADPHIVTTTPNEEIPLKVLSIFPFDMVEVNTGMGMEKHGHAVDNNTQAWDSNWARPKLKNSKNTGSLSEYTDATTTPSPLEPKHRHYRAWI
ncbi:hypothetical protein GOBAR_AA17056 [Gossypium barbadense]|uniref:Uncharacterized protein n=1 Tax=Gossypium barbadense TaxID=3634 RepID=A0A2P5XJY9_GOSBA|nr:hypothetical protein GOBAR_AA17056 [Gossypium barbadense]